MSGKYQSLYVNLSSSRQVRSSSPSRIFGKVIGTLLLVILLIGALGRIYLDRMTTKMIQEWQTKYEQLNMLKKETENLKLEREIYMSGNHILRQAERLDLRPSEPGQVRIMNTSLAEKNKRAGLKPDSLIALR